MNIRKIIALLVCFTLTFTIIPVNAIVSENVSESEQDYLPEVEEYEQTNTIGEIGGYLSGNAIIASRLFAEQKFNLPGGTGFAAERANNLIDIFKGLNSSVTGDDSQNISEYMCCLCEIPCNICVFIRKFYLTSEFLCDIIIQSKRK